MGKNSHYATLPRIRKAPFVDTRPRRRLSIAGVVLLKHFRGMSATLDYFGQSATVVGLRANGIFIFLASIDIDRIAVPGVNPKRGLPIVKACQLVHCEIGIRTAEIAIETPIVKMVIVKLVLKN